MTSTKKTRSLFLCLKESSISCKFRLSYWYFLKIKNNCSAHSFLTLTSYCAPVLKQCVKHLAASWSLLRFTRSIPLCRRYFCLRTSNGITGAPSLPSVISFVYPLSRYLIMTLAISRIFSAVRIFLLFRFTYARQIVILMIKSMKRGCWSLGLEGSTEILISI